MKTTDNILEGAPHYVLIASIRVIDVRSKMQFLSNDERLRCERFRQDDDQLRYILAHTLKRICLARYLNCAPESLEFKQGAKGKPYCTMVGAPDFNLSHSGDFVLVGVSAANEIGVDVEKIRRDVSPGVMEWGLTADQQLQLSQSADSGYEFICYWTQKEAISKALGLGLSINFKTIQCSGIEGECTSVHSGQTLLVTTQQWDEKHIISVASSSSVAPAWCELDAWEESLSFSTSV